MDTSENQQRLQTKANQGNILAEFILRMFYTVPDTCFIGKISPVTTNPFMVTGWNQLQHFTGEITTPAHIHQTDETVQKYLLQRNQSHTQRNDQMKGIEQLLGHFEAGAIIIFNGIVLSTLGEFDDRVTYLQSQGYVAYRDRKYTPAYPGAGFLLLEQILYSVCDSDLQKWLLKKIFLPSALASEREIYKITVNNSIITLRLEPLEIIDFGEAMILSITREDNETKLKNTGKQSEKSQRKRKKKNDKYSCII
ncbi:MAG: hypothetical protein ACOCXT_04455 [Candidatus Dojkabacteria bacterium]